MRAALIVFTLLLAPQAFAASTSQADMRVLDFSSTGGGRFFLQCDGADRLDDCPHPTLREESNGLHGLQTHAAEGDLRLTP